MNVFDLKSALSAKHAQHVVLIHFPIALFITGVGFDSAAHWMKRTLSNPAPWKKPSMLAAAAYVNLLAAAVFALPVVATGLLAWRWQLEGQRLHGILLLHLVLGSISAALIVAVGWIHFRAHRTEPAQLPTYRLPLEFIAALVVAATGHVGGFLSGVNLPG